MKTSRETTAPRYFFDDVEVDCRNFAVAKGGGRKVLNPRAFDVLRYLIEHRGRVVEKAELFERVWQERFVSDNALTRAVADIRQALRDSATAPRYIKTVPKRGYHFVADVRDGSESGPSHASDLCAPPAPAGQAEEPPAACARLLPGSVNRRGLAAAALVLLLTAVGVSSVFLLGGRRAPSNSMAVTPVTEPGGGPGVDKRPEQLETQETRRPGGRQTEPGTAGVAGRVPAGSEQPAVEKPPTSPSPQKVRPPQSPTGNAEAYQLYLRGRRLLDTLDPVKAQQGIECFRQAIDLDPGYALAYVGLADYYLDIGSRGGNRPHVYAPMAKAVAARALELDETLAEAHATQALIFDLYDWDRAAAEKELRRALELNPNSDLVRRDLAIHLSLQGRVDEALAESKKELALDPLNARLNLNAGWILYGARRYEQALTHFQQMIAAGVYVPGSYSWLAQIYEAQGRYEQAVEMDLRYRSLSRAAPQTTIDAFQAAYTTSGWEGYWQKVLEQRKVVAARRYVEPYGFATLYARLGEKEQAMQWLEKAYLERSMFMTRLARDPGFDGLRAEPRFQDLIRRLGPSSAR